MPDDDDDLRLTPIQVRLFAETAEPLTRLTYFVGNLAAERLIDRRVQAVACEAYDVAQKGLCRLLQRRHSQEAMTYLLEKR